MATPDDRRAKHEESVPPKPDSISDSDSIVWVRSSDTEATIPPITGWSSDSTAPGDSSSQPAMSAEFDGYEVLDEIARGGMGIVYKARQTALDRIVALKTVIAGRFASGDAIRLFQTEAKAAGQLNHPGIVPVYDVGESNGIHYFSMPLIDGVSLSDRTARGPMDPDDAAKIMKTVAETIHIAHQRSLVHRDLKPGDILIDSQGQPLITDFGIARRIDDQQNPGDVDALMGTAEYMSPEQASGEPTGPLGDVYSLGATLYCLLTGRPPFQSHNTLDTLLAVLESDPVPPRRLNEGIPRDLELICLKCMQKKSQNRYQSGMEIAQELSRFLEGEPVLVHPVGNIGTFLRLMRRQPRTTVLATGLVVCFTAAMAISVYYNFQLNMQRNVAESALYKAQRAEARARSLQTVTEELLTELASTESSVLHALEYSSLGEVSLSAIRLSKTPRSQMELALSAFQSAQTGLNDKQQAHLQPVLDRIESHATGGKVDSNALSSDADELVEATRKLWLAVTEDSSEVRQPIRAALYTQTRQLVDSIVAAEDYNDVTRDIESLLDLIHADLFIVAPDNVYLTAVQLSMALEGWTDGSPPDALKTAAADLYQSLGTDE